MRSPTTFEDYVREEFDTKHSSPSSSSSSSSSPAAAAVAAAAVAAASEGRCSSGGGEVDGSGVGIRQGEQDCGGVEAESDEDPLCVDAHLS